MCMSQWSPGGPCRRCYPCGPWVGTGWVYRVGIQGGYRGSTTQPPREEDPSPAERAPEAPVGLEWVGDGVWTRVPGCSAAGTALYHPAGPVGSPWAPPCTGPQNAASGPIGARFDLISYKVSKNGQVSPKKCEKASHSPYIPKRVQKVAS